MNIFGTSNTTQPPANTGYGSPLTPSTPSQGKCECVYQDSITKMPCKPSSLSNLYGLLGGRRRRNSMKRGGSFRPSSDLGVASTASPFSGGRTAQPHNWTGGRRRTRSSKRRTRRFKCNKCSKRRRHKH
jgi:hypothetical protein